MKNNYKPYEPVVVNTAEMSRHFESFNAGEVLSPKERAELTDKRTKIILDDKFELGTPHIWIYLYDSIWVCEECNSLKWMPEGIKEARALTIKGHNTSPKSAYEFFISKLHPEIGEIITLMESTV